MTDGRVPADPGPPGHVAELLWQSVYDSPIDAIFLVDDDTGQVVDANPTACALLGWSRDELRGVHRDRLLDTTDPGLGAALDERERNGRAVARVVMLRQDAVRVPALMSSVRTTWPDGRVVNVTICRDVSEFEDVRAHLDVIQRNTPDLLMSLDPTDLGLIWWNEALRASVARTLGPVELRRGMGADEVFPDPDMATWWTNAARQCLTEGEYSVAYSIGGLTFDVMFRPVELASGGRAVLIHARDVTAELAVLERLADSEEKYRSVVASMAEGVVFQAADGRIVETNAAARLIEGRADDEMLGKTSDDEQWGAIREDGSEFPGEDHPAMVTLRTGEPQEGVVMGIRQPDGSRRWISINSQPLRLRASGDEISVVTTFHDVTARKQVEQQLQHQVERLERLVEQTLDAVGAIVESRDAYTSGHMSRVADLSDRIAAELGWPLPQRRVLSLAAAVHDVGKVAVPLELLTKPARLSAAEMDVVRSHAEHGYRILSRIDFGVPIAEIVHQHHEWMDGTGYPQGLRGDAIMPAARIITVADVVESMASHRPYRPALGVAAAIEEIQRHRGTRYDAEVVDAFVRLVERGYELPEPKR